MTDGWLDVHCAGPHMPMFVRTWGDVGYFECMVCGVMVEGARRVGPRQPADAGDGSGLVARPLLEACIRDARDQKIAAMRGDGKTLTEIGRHFSLHVSRVHQILARMKAKQQEPTP